MNKSLAMFPKGLINRLILLSCFVSLTLLLSDQLEIVIAWWIMVACFIPALIWVKKTCFLSVKIVVWTSFITQAVTMPLFYLNPKDYNFQRYRPFNFTGLESLDVFHKIGIFLLILLFFAGIWEKLLKKPKRENYLVISSENAHWGSSPHNLINNMVIISQSKSLISAGFIIIIIVLMIPLNNWMFEMKIGLTGIPATRLPYRLSGILTYLAKIVIPLLLSFLYLRTRRQSFWLVIILGFYSIFLGVSTVSRAAALMVIICPLVFSLLDRRWVLFLISIVFAAFGLSLTTSSREIVFLVVGNFSDGNTTLGVIGTLLTTAEELKWDKLLLIIPFIIGRFESFQSLWLASHVNSAVMGGGWAVWTKTIDWNLIDLGHDAIHLEVLGYTVPQGFYNVSSSMLAYMLWSVGGSWFFYIPFAIWASSFLVLQERSLRTIEIRYAVNPLILNSLVTGLSLSYFASIGFPFGNFIFIALLVVSRLPKSKTISSFLKYIGFSTRKPR